jgi:hypothetical protein
VTGVWTAFAALLAAHGAAHSLAFAVAWKLTEPEDLPYTTKIFGSVDLGAVGIRIVGLLWLAALAAFLLAAARVWRRSPGATLTVFAATVLSTLLCLTQPGRAAVGLAIDAALLVGLLVVASRGHRSVDHHAAALR